LSKFIWAADEQLLSGRPVLRPRTARELLRQLDVPGSSTESKREAVREWLTRNVPDALMLKSLERAGLPTTLLDVAPPASPLEWLGTQHATIVIGTKLRSRSTSSLV
jgi:hypothetical protein